MAGIIPDGQPVPEGVRSVGQAREYQLQTEESVRAALGGDVFAPFAGARSALVNNILGPIGDALRTGVASHPWFNKIAAAGQQYISGQEALNHRTDLLSPLQDYGSVYMDDSTVWSSGTRMPFTNQIGPMRGCRLQDRGIVLLDRGLWQINAQVWADFNWITSGILQWEIRVLRPNGSLFDVKRARMNSNSQFSNLCFMTCVVPGPNYKVEVHVTDITGYRGLLGGPDRNGLAVQHITRETREVNLPPAVEGNLS